MTRIPMSATALALLRALIARSGAPRDRILLTDAHSADWQSLTFTGERHHISLRVPGRDSAIFVERMVCGLSDAEFSIPGVIVADIGIVGQPQRAPDGATAITIEALTVSDD